MAKRTDDLMKALQRAPVPKAVAPVSIPLPSNSKKITASISGRGKPMNLYFHPDDLKRIRTLGAYLSMQGERVSDSQVVKAALRVASGNDALLSAYRDAASNDQRFKRAKTETR